MSGILRFSFYALRFGSYVVMKITIRDITGHAEERLDLESGATVGTLWELLVARYPRLSGYSGRLLYAINQEFATLASELHDGDEIAFIPPVSGGIDGELKMENGELRNELILHSPFSILHSQ